MKEIDDRGDDLQALRAVGAQPEGKTDGCEEPGRKTAESVSRFRGGD